MDALKKVLAPEAYAKLERLVALDSRYQPHIFLLDLCAFILLSVSYGVAQKPLDSMDDLANFSFDGLDVAALFIGAALHDIWPKDPMGSLFEYVEVHGYRLSEDYADRKVRVIESGKYPLLLRISQRIAEQRAS